MAAEYFRRTMVHIDLSSGATDPDVYIGIRADFFSPMVRTVPFAREAAALTKSLTGGDMIPPSENTPERPLPHLMPPIVPPPPEKKERKVRKVSTRKKKVDDYLLMQKFYEGKTVQEIKDEVNCSEAYVYQTIKRIKGISAMDLRYQRWKMIADLYFAKPRRTVDEIEKLCNVSRWQIYNAVRNVAKKEGITLSEEYRNKKLTEDDVAHIRQALKDGVTRKVICWAYEITGATLIKYIGPDENHKVYPQEYQEKVVKLRVAGKTLAETASLLNVSVDYVKEVWKKYRNSDEVVSKRVKYDNRNRLNKHDQDRAVKAVLFEGITRKKIAEQYGINALTLRRYIKKFKDREVEAIRNITDKIGENNPQPKKKKP
ncbi:helix-turn-helix domain-containing protein [Erwinia typographi]|nr:hypothetical protein [Erwinia typographi]